MVYYNAGLNSSFNNVKNLVFENTNRTGSTILNGVVGLRVGRKLGGITGNFGSCNMTIRKNQFLYCETPVEIWSESDQVTIDDNYMFVYTVNGILCTADPVCVTGTGNSAVRVTNNHIMGGQAGSIAVTLKGAAVSVKGNTIQNATGANGIYLDGCTAFDVSGNYTETTIGAVYWIRSVASFAGYIGENTVGGYAGATLIDINAASHDINIGPNHHNQAGGSALHGVTIASGASGINVVGKQYSTGISNDIFGGPNLLIDGDGLLQSLKFNSASGFQNVASFSTVDLFTAPALGATCYLVYITQAANNYEAVALVTFPDGLSAGVVTQLMATNVGLSVGCTGLVIQAVNGVVGSKTVKYSIIRIS
jgi:hypothetical protein